MIAINQTHIIRMKEFQQRRMDYLQRTLSQNEPLIEQEAFQAAILQAKAMAGYQNQLMAAGLGTQGQPSSFGQLHPQGALMGGIIPQSLLMGNGGGLDTSNFMD